MKYLLSEDSAAWLRRQKAASANVSAADVARARRQRPAFFAEDEYPHPYEVRYSESAAEGGAWIIWLPERALEVNGIEINLIVDSGLTPVEGFPAGWYDLSAMFDGAVPPDEFDIYLDAIVNSNGEAAGDGGAVVGPRFRMARGGMTNPVLIAKVKGKSVKGIVESALHFIATAENSLTIRVHDFINGGSTDAWTDSYTDTKIVYKRGDQEVSTPRQVDIPGVRQGMGIRVEKKGNCYEISLKKKNYGGGGASGDDDDGNDGEEYVRSVNSLDGDVNIIGGENIEVETDPKTNTIVISYKEGKEADAKPAEEVDQCVDPGDSGGGGAGGGVPAGGGGGVPADSDYHTGDDDVCCC